jgi:hypothetical protein
VLLDAAPNLSRLGFMMTPSGKEEQENQPELLEAASRPAKYGYAHSLIPASSSNIWSAEPFSFSFDHPRTHACSLPNTFVPVSGHRSRTSAL